MKVLNICRADYANYSHDNANALRSNDIECVDVKLEQHPFNYISQSRVISKPDILEMMPYFDVIQIFHSCIDCLDLVEILGIQKKTVVYHTGTPYRTQPDFMRLRFKDVAASFTDQCEFIKLDSKLKYIAPAVYVPELSMAKNKRFGHYPSDMNIKGTIDINTTFNQLQIPIDIRTNILPHQEQLDRMAQCDVYVELFRPTLNGKEYGCYGTSAFEAAAHKCIVLTQNLNPRVYENEYGRSMFYYANSINELKHYAVKFHQAKNLTSLQAATYEWVKEKHSFEATGKKIIENLSNVLN